jgi:hypothetical protein
MRPGLRRSSRRPGRPEPRRSALSVRPLFLYGIGACLIVGCAAFHDRTPTHLHSLSGFCWGAKVLIQSSSLDAKAGVHPSLFSKDDLALLTVPTALYPTAEEDMEVFNVIKEGLDKKDFKAYVEHLPGQPL